MESSRKLVHSDVSFPEKLIGLTTLKLNLVSNTNGEIMGKIVTGDESIAHLMDEIYNEEIRPLWLEIVAEGKRQGFIDAKLDDEALLIYLDILRAGAVKKDFVKDWSGNMNIIQQLSHIIFYGFMKKEVDFFVESKKQAIK
jgi:hypothetical protein